MEEVGGATRREQSGQRVHETLEDGAPVRPPAHAQPAPSGRAADVPAAAAAPTASSAAAVVGT